MKANPLGRSNALASCTRSEMGSERTPMPQNTGCALRRKAKTSAGTAARLRSAFRISISLFRQKNKTNAGETISSARASVQPVLK